MEVELPLEGLVGRQRELVDLDDLLGAVRFVTITGFGGTGKTRLARAVAQRRRATGKPAVWVDLAPIVDADGMAVAIADALELVDRPALRPLDVVLGRLEGWTGLLVLDNVEQLVAPTAPEAVRGDTVLALKRISHASGDLELLTTSRILTGVGGEAAFPLGPLDVGSDEQPAAPDTPCMELFLREARRTGGIRRGAEPDLELVRRICRAVGGLPLGIELAAARARVMSLRAIADGVEHRRADAPEGNPLAAILEWTTGLLAEDDVARLRVLSFFPSDFNLTEAAVAWGLPSDDAAVESVDQLVQLGLAMRTSDERFQLPVPVRQWATPASSDPFEGPFRRLAAYLIERAATAAPDVFGTRVAETIVELRRVEPLLRVVLDRAIDTDPSLAARILEAFRAYWTRADRVREVRDRCRRLMDAPLSDPERAWICWLLADAELAIGGPAAALPIAERGLRAATDAGDAGLRQMASFQIGRLRGAMLDLAGSRAALTAALELARERADTAAVVMILDHLATAWLAEGDAAASNDLLDEAAELARSVGDRFGLAYVTAGSAFSMGIESPEALHRLEEATAVFRDLGPSQYLAWSQLSLAEALLAAGRTGEAATLLVETFPLVASHGSWQERATSAEVTGVLLHLRGRDHDAAAAFGLGARIRAAAGSSLSKEGPWTHAILTGIRERLGEAAFAVASADADGRGDVDPYPRLAALIELPAVESWAGDGAFGRLTKRELEVLDLVGLGRTDQEIAGALGMSPKTASVHVSNIKTKLGVETRIDLAMAARGQRPS